MDGLPRPERPATPNPPTNIVDFSGFDSSIMLIYRGRIPRHIGNFPEDLTQAMLVGTMLVGRLGVIHLARTDQGPRTGTLLTASQVGKRQAGRSKRNTQNKREREDNLSLSDGRR